MYNLKNVIQHHHKCNVSCVRANNRVQKLGGWMKTKRAEVKKNVEKCFQCEFNQLVHH